ncbi:MAG TPA: sorbosone dehydrogenase family protein [Steroidobacteraceae bacterium]|nr:sorbosone dehydrogenase family protein [Steroidobacteraceae bacterium]
MAPLSPGATNLATLDRDAETTRKTLFVMIAVAWTLLFGLEALFAMTAHADDRSAKNADTGPSPTLVAPKKQAIPKVNVAKAIGWQGESQPTTTQGFVVNAYATELQHPRWLYVLPNGDILVAETNAPERKDENKGVRGWFMKQAMKDAGAGVPSANRITLLRDADKDGVAETRTAFLSGLTSPFGMALVGNTLYVANTDAIVKFQYTPGATEIKGQGEKVADLPAGTRNHHWTKNIIASADGTKLYATVGSNSNVAEHGMEQEVNRAAILEVDVQTGKTRVFASGIRNPNGLAWQPASRLLWTAVNERDEIGDDLVPDYMTSVRDGEFFGWPYSYYGANIDERVEKRDNALIAKARKPDYALGSHTASLGLVFYPLDGTAFPDRYRGGAFVGQHGSWNRGEFAGYKVIFVPFDAAGKPAGPIEEFLTGFLDKEGQAMGRPVGVAVDRSGALLVADDVGNRIWRIVATTKTKT